MRARRPSTRTVLAMALIAAAAAALAVIATSATWRLAVLAGAVAALLAVTRLRYAPAAAVGTLALVAALAASGRTAGADPRPTATRAGAERPPSQPDRGRDGQRRRHHRRVRQHDRR
jgi:hypothetical protein